MKRFLLQSLLLCCCITLVLLWQTKLLSNYTDTLIGLLTLSYLLMAFGKGHKPEAKKTINRSIIMCLLLTATVLLVIFSTGILGSFIFFLLYFLLFYLSFTLMPECVFVFSLLLFLLFLPRMDLRGIIANSAQLVSLLLLTPLAYFFGKEIQSRKHLAKQVQFSAFNAKRATERIRDDIDHILRDNGSAIPMTDRNRLHDIKTQTELLKKEMPE